MMFLFESQLLFVQVSKTFLNFDFQYTARLFLRPSLKRRQMKMRFEKIVSFHSSFDVFVELMTKVQFVRKGFEPGDTTSGTEKLVTIAPSQL